MTRMHFSLLRALVGFAAVLCYTLPAMAQATAPPLGVVQQFGALGASGVTGSAGVPGMATTVSGDVGSSPTPAVTNFPPSTVTPGFTVHLTNDTVVQQAHADAITAYNFLAAQGPGTVIAAQLNGAILSPGIYSFAGGAADLAATGTLNLQAGIYVFNITSSLTANVGSTVTSPTPCSVFWRVGSSATLNGLNFAGQVFADESITVGVGSNVSGRTIAGAAVDPNGAVTMAGGPNTIGGCAAPGVIPPFISPAAGPTLDFVGLTILMFLLVGAGLFVMNKLSI